MTATARALAFWAAAASGMGFAARADDGVFGFWRVESGAAVVQIVPCGAQACGVIVGLRNPNGDDGKPAHDFRNPDESLRSRPICGMALMKGFDRADAGWEGGEIYSAEDGKTYNAKMRLDGPDTLVLRGYVGIPLLGATQRWTREAGPGGGC